MQQGEGTAARPLLESLTGGPLPSGYLNATLALLLSRLGEHQQAEEYYRHAISLEPRASQHYYNLATVQRFQGHLEAAESSLDNALAINPRDYEAHKLRADLQTQTPEHNHIPLLERLLEEGIDDPRARVEILYALAKEREDVGEFDASFAALQQASEQRRAQMRYAPEGDVATMQAITQHFGRAWSDTTRPGTSEAQPVFILGMPRTGSTLLEHILAAHSRVDSAGELNNFAIEMVRLVRSGLGEGQQVDKQSMVKLSARLDFATLGQRYVDSLPTHASGHGHLIDKMPLNFLYAGLIHKALPRARIIHIRRDPVDTCYAIYKTSFRDAYPFSYRLEELADYYLAYRRLMSHWESLLGDALYSVSYESLVENTEQEVRRLLAFCELDFQSACLAPETGKLASTTASASQVRRPVYQSSVGKSRHYLAQLEPLVNRLAEAGCDGW